MRVPVTEAPKAWLWAAAGVAVALAALAAGAGPLITSTAAKPVKLPSLRPAGGQGFRPTPPPSRARVLDRQRPSSPGDALHVVSVVLTVLAIVGLALIVALAVRSAIRKYRGPLDRDTDDPTVTSISGDAEAAAQVRSAVRRALDALDDETDPRRAVVACWLQFEAALRDQGMTRDAAETATELSGRAVASYPVSPDLIARLNRLFRSARYSAAPVSLEAPAAARAVLEEIRSRLGRQSEPVG